MRAVAYARVSSAAQRDRDTIASQLRVLPEFIERQGWELVRPIGTYVDDGHTAKAGHLEARRGLTALLRDAAAGVYDVVVVVDVDRLTRSEDLTERGAILGAFQRAGVRVASANTGQVLDLSTSIGDLFGTLQVFFAAEENRKRSSRIAEGKVTALQRGRKPSGPTPYGLAYDRELGAWSLHPQTAPIVAEIFERVAAGEACGAIAEDLHERGVPRPRGTWAGHRVWGIVRSRHPVGEWTGDRKRKLVVSVPPIVTEATWQRAQDALLRHKRRGLRKTKHVYLLEGLARCGGCGAAILIRSASGKLLPDGSRQSKAAYVCRARKLELRGAGRCNALIMGTADVDARVWSKLVELVRVPALLEQALAHEGELGAEANDWKADADGYRRRITLLDRSESALLARFSRGTVSEQALDRELARLGPERDMLRVQLAAAERAALQAESNSQRLGDAQAMLAALAPAMDDAPQDLRRELVQRFLRTVTFHGREIRFVAAVPRVTRASADPSLALADASFWDVERESDVQIRLVA